MSKTMSEPMFGRCDAQTTLLAASRIFWIAGKSIANSKIIMAITTISSTSVKPRRFPFIAQLPWVGCMTSSVAFFAAHATENCAETQAKPSIQDLAVGWCLHRLDDKDVASTSTASNRADMEGSEELEC